jgi:GAF domain-containing protein
LASAFVSLTDTLVDDFDAVDLLYELIAICVDVLDASAAVCFSPATMARCRLPPRPVRASGCWSCSRSRTRKALALTAFRSGSPVRTERLDGSETRWPQFAPAASEQGFVQVLALPMRLRGQVIGALNLLGDTNAPSISTEAVPVAQAMADVATIAILTDRLARSRDLLAAQLQGALDSRVLIERVKGTLATRLDIDHDEAFALIRQRSRDQNRPLREVAAEVTATRPEGDWQQFRSLQG